MSNAAWMLIMAMTALLLGGCLAAPKVVLRHNFQSNTTTFQAEW